MSRIPSDDDFERASKHIDARLRNLDSVCDSVLRRFQEECPLYDFYILPQRDVEFRAYVFFETNKDIEDCQGNGTLERLKDFVIAELQRVGRARGHDLKIAFEVDSDENVKANYEGDYFLRLR
jgi:hypothetical protein